MIHTVLVLPLLLVLKEPNTEVCKDSFVCYRFLLCNQTSLPSWRPAVLKRGTSVNVPSHHEATATPPEEEYEDISDHEDMVTDIDAVGRESEEGRRECGEDRGEEMARLTIEVGEISSLGVARR